MSKKTRYIPAMHYHWLTPLYDPLLQWTMPDQALKDALLRQASIRAGETVLDLGCGTATFTVQIKREYPDTKVVGLDIDPRILAIARRKAQHANLKIVLHRGTATQLPYPHRCFDRVLSCFVFHHLTSEEKHCAAAEVFRILRSGGELLVLDFGKPHNGYARVISYLTRWAEELMDNVQGRLPEMFRSAGFSAVQEVSRHATLFGTVSLYRARKL